LGTGEQIAIEALTEKIKAIVGFNGSVEWDATKPEGQKRRYLDVSKAYERFGFRAKTGIDEGLEKTVRWYMDNTHTGKEN
jgi:GDP-L-fucose synthase